jgi:hypothetical protein
MVTNFHTLEDVIQSYNSKYALSLIAKKWRPSGISHAEDQFDEKKLQLARILHHGQTGHAGQSRPILQMPVQDRGRLRQQNGLESMV